MKWNVGNWRLWLFRGLVAIAAGLILTSAILPWWTCTVNIPMTSLEDPQPKPLHVTIYQYGLRHDFVQLRDYVAADETPFYQSALAWAYIAASIGLVLFSTLLKSRKGRWLLGGIGLTYIAYVVVAIFVVVANRIADFGISLQGWSNKSYVEVVVSYFSSLQPGYYLVYAAGGMCIALALLRNIITGRPELEHNKEQSS